jgi:hypothetical protein
VCIFDLLATAGLAAETERLDALLTAMARHHHMEQALGAASAAAAASGPRSPSNSFKHSNKSPGLDGEMSQGGADMSLTSPLVTSAPSDLAKRSVSSLAGGGGSNSQVAMGVPVLLRTVPHFTLSRQEQLESLGMLTLHGGAPSLISRSLVPGMQVCCMEEVTLVLSLGW